MFNPSKIFCGQASVKRSKVTAAVVKLPKLQKLPNIAEINLAGNYLDLTKSSAAAFNLDSLAITNPGNCSSLDNALTNYLLNNL
jgi:hypothetical protein